uniref:Uncharacterized protein n=1 Tax=Avena sativa TaxID=4498 RepID=A0ACD5YJ04_AVESA
MWTARRKTIHEEIFQNLPSTLGFINSFIKELHDTSKPSLQATAHTTTPETKPIWIPPPDDTLKINVDVDVSKSDIKGVIATVFVPHLGASIVFNDITDPAILEPLACREALALARDLRIVNVLIVSHCKNVVSNIADGSLAKNSLSSVKSEAAQHTFRIANLFSRDCLQISKPPN